MELNIFDFVLPKELIAQKPMNPRDASRLLHIAANGELMHYSFSGSHGHGLKSLLRKGDVIVFNDTKVIPARLQGYKDNSYGIRKEIPCNLMELIEKKTESERWKTLIKGRVKIGDEIIFSPNLLAKVKGRLDEFVLLDFIGDFDKVVNEIGTMPLPPYIKRGSYGSTSHNIIPDNGAKKDDAISYQTVYANEAGAVAAPTAGLHFTRELMNEILDMGVEIHYITLHVGGGTFLPIRCSDVTNHKMHREMYSIPKTTADAVNQAKIDGRRVIAVGTTSLRALESSTIVGQNLQPIVDDELQVPSPSEPNSLSVMGINLIHQANYRNRVISCDKKSTNIFIYPGYDFRMVDALITNFHLPKTTLFLLVCAFAGTERMKRAYEYAIDHQYRFFSYGDGSLIEKRL